MTNQEIKNQMNIFIELQIEMNSEDEVLNDSFFFELFCMQELEDTNLDFDTDYDRLRNLWNEEIETFE